MHLVTLLFIWKDHCSGGGGFFLAISSGIPFLDVSIDTNVEAIWAKILPIQGETLLLGSLYRPPDSNPIPMEEFKVFLSSFSQAKNFKNIIIAGDFNFPSIIWEDGVGRIEGTQHMAEK